MLTPRDSRIRRLVLVLLLAVLGGSGTRLFVHGFIPPSGSRQAEGGQAGIARTVQAKTSTARQGAYYLPGRYESRALPLMVGFHGTGGKGSLMVLRLRTLAERVGFIVLAPDSVSVAGVWSVAQRPDEVTEDYRHAMACVQELLQVRGVRVDSARVLAAGFSVGGSVAPYVATRERLFSAFAVLHGHVVPASWGALRPRAFLSAGDHDRVRTVEQVKSVAEYLTRTGFSAVEMRIFKADHRLTDEELETLVAWWLGSSRPSA